MKIPCSTPTLDGTDYCSLKRAYCTEKSSLGQTRLIFAAMKSATLKTQFPDTQIDPCFKEPPRKGPILHLFWKPGKFMDYLK